MSINDTLICSHCGKEFEPYLANEGYVDMLCECCWKLYYNKLGRRIETLHELESVIYALLPEFKAKIIRVHELHKPNSSILKLWIEIKGSEEKVC